VCAPLGRQQLGTQHLGSSTAVPPHRGGLHKHSIWLVWYAYRWYAGRGHGVIMSPVAAWYAMKAVLLPYGFWPQSWCGSCKGTRLMDCAAGD
jgi:hypothetical protein